MSIKKILKQKCPCPGGMLSDEAHTRNGLQSTRPTKDTQTRRIPSTLATAGLASSLELEGLPDLQPGFLPFGGSPHTHRGQGHHQSGSGQDLQGWGRLPCWLQLPWCPETSDPERTRQLPNCSQPCWAWPTFVGFLPERQGPHDPCPRQGLASHLHCLSSGTRPAKGLGLSPTTA